MEIKKQKHGFTLIELVIYIGILSILIGVGGDIFAFVIRAYQRAEMISAIELLGNNILTQIEQDTRVSENIVTYSSNNVTLKFSNGLTDRSYVFTSCTNTSSGGVSGFNFGATQNFFNTQIYLNQIPNIDFFVRTNDSSGVYDMLTISFALSTGGTTPCTAPLYTSYFQTIVNLRGGISN
ncbi:type II secretion system protein [Patescibacteria group bacterium]|nr:type II secretion system protein [Patescibacteria group bacterium]